MNPVSRIWSRPFYRRILYAGVFIFALWKYVGGTPSDVSDGKILIPNQKTVESFESERPASEFPSRPTFSKKNDSVVPPASQRLPLAGNGASAVPSPPFWPGETRDYPRTSYNPYTDRPIVPGQAEAIAAKLTSKPSLYPYEVTPEEIELGRKAKNGTLGSAGVRRRLDLAMNPSKKDSVSSGTSLGGRLNSGSASGRGGARVVKNQAEEENSTDSAPKTLQEEYRGRAEDLPRVEYVNHGPAVLSAELERTHSVLEIYEFRPGPNAGLVPGAYGNLTELYLSVEPEVRKNLHHLYQVPPDWNNQWKFSEDPAQEEEVSRAASNRHLLSLGQNGSVTFTTPAGKIVDGPGADFVIWGNPFCQIANEEYRKELEEQKRDRLPVYTPGDGRAVSGVEADVQCETDLGKVFVSVEGPQGNFIALEPCEKSGDPFVSKCFGFGMNLWTQSSGNPSDTMSGGDRYDLSGILVSEIRAIKIVDLNNLGAFEKGGADIDAIAVLHYEADRSDTVVTR